MYTHIYIYIYIHIYIPEACEILIGIQEIDEEKVCKTVPLQFKHEGTFLINTENGYSIIGNDDNGKWGNLLRDFSIFFPEFGIYIEKFKFLMFFRSICV